jgi:hypothetical protein
MRRVISLTVRTPRAAGDVAKGSGSRAQAVLMAQQVDLPVVAGLVIEHALKLRGH